MQTHPAPPTAADLRADVARLQVPVYRLGAIVGVHPGRLGMMLRGSIPLSPAVAVRIRQALDDMHQTGSQHSTFGARGA
jgi:plasmid maintenance system antidote protein VapI